MFTNSIKLVLVVALMCSFVFTGCGDETGPQNEAPLAPSNPNPVSNAVDVSTMTSLSWSCEDPDGDSLTYDVYFGTTLSPSLVSSDQAVNTYTPGQLSNITTYYWHIIAKDDFSNETIGAIWSFTVIENFAPGEPHNPTPAHEASQVAVVTSLSWSCEDQEGDTLAYDVYFGTNPDPQAEEMVAQGQAEAFFDPGQLEYSTTYYWQIIARDDNSNEIEAPIWSFTTIENFAPAEPQNPTPADEAAEISVSATLSWTCEDQEGDTLAYDVYLGTNASPGAEELVSSNQAETTFIPEYLEYNTTYFWQIIAKDSYSNEIAGPVWSFTTSEPAVGDEMTFELGDSGETIEMIWIPSGTFWMGAQEDESDASTDETPRHLVSITEGFWIGKYEITQAQWEAVTGYQLFQWPGNPNHPAENISYFEVINRFLPELSTEWRLPTEAEWEYAARAGVDDAWFTWGSSYENLDDYAWYSGNSSSRTHEVGSKLPNPWGLYDMYGNVNEWCVDWYGREYYEISPVIDPQGPATGSLRVQRGGGWNYIGACCRSANRYFYDPNNMSNDIGFRLVRSGQ